MKWSLLAVALLPLGATLAFQASPTSQLKSHVDKMQAAKSLVATFSVQTIGGASAETTIRLQKPNMVRIDSPEELVVSDGVTVWRLDKKTNGYTEEPIGSTGAPAMLPARFWMLGAFFDAKFAEQFGASKAGKSRKMKGIAISEISLAFAKKPGISATILFDDQVGVSRGIVWHEAKDGATVDTLVFADKLEIGATEAAASEFVFVPGRGHSKVEKSAQTGATWKDVELIFMGTCGACHGAQRPAAGIRLNSYENVMAGRNGNPIVVPGNLEGSSVLRNLKGIGKLMPPGRKMPDETIGKIEKWIADGARK